MWTSDLTKIGARWMGNNKVPTLYFVSASVHRLKANFSSQIWCNIALYMECRISTFPAWLNVA